MIKYLISLVLLAGCVSTPIDYEICNEWDCAPETKIEVER